MPQFARCTTRITRGYRDGWSNLDTWGQPTFKVKVLAGNGKRYREDRDGGYSYFNRVVAMNDSSELHHKDFAKLTDAEIERAIYDTISGSSCRHEHDCCGCASSSITLTKVRKHEWKMETRISYNY
jgi:hypothetical protein